MNVFLNRLMSCRGQVEFLAVTVYGMRILGAALALILQVVLAHYMSQAEFGIFASVWVVMITLGEFLNLGFLSLIQKLIPSFRASGRFDLLRGAILGNGAMILVISVFIALIFGIAIPFVVPVERGYLIAPLYLAAFALPAFAMTDFSSGISRSSDHMVRAFLPSSIIRPILFIMLVVALEGAGGQINSQEAIKLMVFVLWVVLFLAFIFAIMPIWKDIRTGPGAYKFGSWLLMALPMVLVSSFELVLYNVDIFILSLMKDSEVVAVYFAAVKVLSVVNFVGFAVASAVMGRMAGFYATNQTAELSALSLKAVRWTFFPTLGLIGLILLAAPFLLGLFGTAYVAGTSVIAILAVGLFVRAMVGPAERLLIMIGAQNSCALIYICVALLDVGLNILLIPYMGAAGAAMATSLSFCVLSLMLYGAVYKKTGIHMTIFTSLLEKYRSLSTQTDAGVNL